MSDTSPRSLSMPLVRRLGQIIRRIPFTLAMVVLLLLVAWWTHSYFQELARTWVTQLGFAPRDFWFLRWERLILSAMVTSGGGTFWFALGMVAFTSGVIEWINGSWRAGLVFWGIHLATLVLESAMFLLPLHQLGFPQARALFFSRNIGPSAGYVGSLGYLIAFVPKPWRWLAYVAIISILVISLLLPARAGVSQAIKLSDDLAHMIAFSLGGLGAFLFRVKKNR